MTYRHLLGRHVMSRRAVLRQGVLGAAATALAPAAWAQRRPEDDPANGAKWARIRASLFGDQPMADAAPLLSLDAPVRAEDAAVVPLAVKTSAASNSTPAVRIRKLWLVIDENPSPIAAIFEFGPRSARADIETRVRIDAYTYVRAIAETSDGKLHMATKFVKASGGCSAPPGKDPAAAQANLGRMRLRTEGMADAGRPLLAQLMISHPNDSGMVMDQLSRQYTPAHFVRQVEVSYAGEKVLSADLDFAISENPNLRFWLEPVAGAGDLKVEVVDSRDLHFKQSMRLAPGGATGAGAGSTTGSGAGIAPS